MKTISKIGPVDATLDAPPSKSYTARALLMAAMADGPTIVLSALDSDDSRYMLEALRTAGFEITGTLAKGITIGERKSISTNEVEIFVGNAGTAMRFLTGFLAVTPGRFLITGDERMQQRPIGDLVNALIRLGVEVEYAGKEGFPPLRIRGRKMRGGFEIGIDASASSQFLSSLMMAGATLPGGLILKIHDISSRPYIAITADVLRHFGATVEEYSPDIVRVSSKGLQAASYKVEGDYSSASYWFAAAAVTSGKVTVANLTPGSAQGDKRFVDILAEMGCAVEKGEDRVTVRGTGKLAGGSFDCNATPDIVPTLAAIAPLATSAVEITNIRTLRLKESDRIEVLATTLRSLGASVEERDDALTIHPGWSSTPVEVDPRDDHRMAMSFAIAGLARGGISIRNDQVVTKSYPRFWRDLDSVVASSKPI